MCRFLRFFCIFYEFLRPYAQNNDIFNKKILIKTPLRPAGKPPGLNKCTCVVTTTYGKKL